MIPSLLARKLVTFVLYSAAVTALPVLATTPAVKFAPVFKAETQGEVAGAAPACTPVCSCSCGVDAAPPASSGASGRARECCPWWERGPLRRGLRGVARLIARPWRA